MARVVLSGYYGLGNAGDEAVLAAIVQALRERDPGGRITVLSAAPGFTREVHGVEAVRRTDLRAVIAALGEADLLISGGGSLLQDVTSLRSLLYYLGVVALARARRVPVFFYAQGVGPLRRRVARWLAGRVARGVAGITVRDAASADLLREVGVTRPEVVVTADPVFAFRPAQSAGSAGRPVFGFAFRPWAGEEEWVPEVARAAGELAEQYGAELRWLSFQGERDLPVAKALAAACPAASTVVEPGRTPEETWAQVAGCDLLVGARLHALIMAAAAGRPLVGVSYDPKVDALLTDLGLALAGRLPGVTAKELAAAVEKTWERRAEMATELAPRVAERRRRAEATADLALACASRGSGAGTAPEPGRTGRVRRVGRAGQVDVLGVGVDPVTLEEAVRRVGEWIEAARRVRGAPGETLLTRQVVTLNPEMVMAARGGAGFAELIAGADLVTADGVGVVWAARRLGRPLPGRVTGVDLTAALFAAGASRGWHFHFLGAAPGVAEEAAQAAAHRYPGLQVVGTRHGYFPSSQSGEVAAEVAAAAPDVLLVALGSPAQERFIAHHRRNLQAGVALGVGGTLDVLAGRARRAPAWAQRLGLEWLYRLARDPRRWRRALALPAFVWAVWRRSRR